MTLNLFIFLVKSFSVFSDLRDPKAKQKDVVGNIRRKHVFFVSACIGSTKMFKENTVQ